MVKSLEAFAKLRRKSKDEDGEPQHEAREFRDPSGPGPWDEIYDTPNEGYVAEMERRARIAAREAYGQPDECQAKSETLDRKSEIGQHTREYYDSSTDPQAKSETLNPKSEFGGQAAEGCPDPQSHGSQPATESAPGLFDPTSTIATLVTIDPNHTIAPGHPEPVDSIESIETELEPGGREVAGFSTETRSHEVAEFPSEPNRGKVAGSPTETKNREVAEFPNEPNDGEVAEFPGEPNDGEVAQFPSEPNEGEVAELPSEPNDREVAASEAGPTRQVTFARELILSVLFLLTGSSLLAAGFRPECGSAALVSASAPSPGLRPTSPLPSPPTSCGDLSHRERWSEVEKANAAVRRSGTTSATRRRRPGGERDRVRGRGQKDPRQRAASASAPSPGPRPTSPRGGEVEKASAAVARSDEPSAIRLKLSRTMRTSTTRTSPSSSYRRDRERPLRGSRKISGIISLTNWPRW